MRNSARILSLLSILLTVCSAHVNQLPPHSIAPTAAASSHFHHHDKRGGSGSGTLDSAAQALESSVMSLANSASKAVKGQGVCSTNSTCAGFIHFAQVCSEKEDSAAIASCICSSTSLEVMNACTNCISNNDVKANANPDQEKEDVLSDFSSFCNSASSTLAILAATQSSTAPSTLLPTSSSTTNDQHSSATRSTFILRSSRGGGGGGSVLTSTTALTLGLIGLSSFLL